MKVRLLHPERDPDFQMPIAWALRDLTDDDLELPRVYQTMAAGDNFLRDTAKKVISLPVIEPEVIVYRQNVLADCLTNRHVVHQMYDIAVDAVDVRRKIFLGGMMSRNPEAILRRSVRILELLYENLQQLRSLCDEHAGKFSSDGFRQLFAMVANQLSDDYLGRLSEQLTRSATAQRRATQRSTRAGQQGQELRTPPSATP